jgi:hypothetical protein
MPASGQKQRGGQHQKPETACHKTHFAHNGIIASELDDRNETEQKKLIL